MKILNPDESIDNSICADPIRLAERELASFIGAVKEFFGQEQALLSAIDWLDESELMDGPCRSTGRDWREVTVVASARLAKRVTSAGDHRSLVAFTDTSAPQAAPSNRFSCSTLMV